MKTELASGGTYTYTIGGRSTCGDAVSQAIVTEKPNSTANKDNYKDGLADNIELDDDNGGIFRCGRGFGFFSIN